MPAGPAHLASSLSPAPADQSAASILQSVKEQEAQFEALTRELEAERQSVANQLERCKFGSETASLSSISSTDESFHWRPPPKDAYIDEEESDADSKVSGSQLVDSCLRVLQERGLMGNIGEDPSEYLPSKKGQNDSIDGLDRNTSTLLQHNLNQSYSPNEDLPPRSSGSNTKLTINNNNSMMMQNGPNSGMYDSPGSPNAHTTSSRSVVVTKTVTTSVMHPGQSDSPGPQQDSFYGNNSGYPHEDPRQYNGDGNDSRYGNNEDPYSTAPPQKPLINNSFGYGSSQNVAPAGNQYDDRYSDRGGVAAGAVGLNDSFSDRGGGNGSVQGQNYGSYRPQEEEETYVTKKVTTTTTTVLRGGVTDPDYNGSESNGYPPHPGPNSSTFQEDPYGTRGNPPPQPPSVQEDPYASYRGPGSNAGDDPYRYRQQASPVPSPRPPHSPASSRGGGAGGGPYSSQGRLVPRYDPDQDREGSQLGSYNAGYEGSQPNLATQEDPYQDPPYGSRSHLEPQYGSRSQLEPPYGTHSQLQDPQQYDRRTPSPYGGSSARLGAPGSNSGGSQLRLGPTNGGPYDTNSVHDSQRSYGGSQNRLNTNPPYGGSSQQLPPYREEDEVDQAVPLGHPMMLGRAPSSSSINRDQRYRDPSLPEVIEYLGHQNPSIQANAAAYLQHLCYNDDKTKTDTRTLNGIPALVQLVNSDIPEVHRAACGALRNLSYGRANTENKRAIKNADGIKALVRLLRHSADNDVKELVTGILWNLSSCPDLKKSIIDDGLSTIVDTVIIPHSGWSPDDEPYDRTRPREVYWSTVFRNASGILRNVSSDGPYARKKLRECRGLPDSMLYIVYAAIGKNDIDNKSVENCVCILRNLSYACQEVEDEKYVQKREEQKKSAKGDSTGCFGGSSSSSKDKKKEKEKKDKKDPKKQNTPTSNNNTSYSTAPPPAPKQGKEILWHPDIVSLYLDLLTDCTNPETLEAAAGAIQNLAACDWKPSEDIREAVRREKGLQIMVELLNLDADRVVCAAATALRNLALNTHNKELIGKYAMKQLVAKLPQEHPSPNDYPMSDDTICAIEATLYEVIRQNQDFAKTLFDEGGVDRLVYITMSRGKFSAKVIKFASKLLHVMWQFKDLHPEYKAAGYTERHFITRTMAAKSASGSQSAVNTLDRPRMDMSRPTEAGVNEHTLPHVQRQPQNNRGFMPEEQRTPPVMDSRGGYPQEDIPLQQMGAGGGSVHGSQHNVTGAGPDYYAQVDRRGTTDDRYNQPQAQYNPYSRGPEPYNTTGGGDNYSQQGGNYGDRYAPSPAPPTYAPEGSYRGDGDNYSQQGGGLAGGLPGGGAYDSRDNYSQQGGGGTYAAHPGTPGSVHDSYERGSDRDAAAGGYRPAGGVQMYQQPPQQDVPEPIYSKPNKQRKPQDPPGGLQLDGAPPGGADSWV